MTLTAKLKRAQQHLEAARTYVGSGVSIVPGSSIDKSPALEAGELETYRKRLATDKELQRWFRWPRRIIVVCGSASGFLEVMDFDNEAETIFPEWYQAVESIARWLPTIETPGGGYHVWYRCETVSPKVILAGDSESKVRIESLGEKCLATAPGGYCDPNKPPRVQVSGPPLPFDIPVIDAAARAEMFEAAERFDERPVKTSTIVETRKTSPIGDKLTPWDDFADRGQWSDLLRQFGWTNRNGRDWLRPEKVKGTSANFVTGTDGRTLLKVWTSSTVFEAGRTYNAFEAYAILVHAGNKSSAGKALVQAGYGGKA